MPEIVSALCINLDSSRAVSGESGRVEQVEREVGRMAGQVRPDVVFTQDKFSARNLERLREGLDNNVPGSHFELEKVFIGSADHVSIFVNKTKFNTNSVEKEEREAIHLHRVSNKDFFNEKRAVFVLASNKQSGYKLLLSSYHAKKNKCTNIKREQLIIEYLTLMEDISKRVGAHGILVGTDINHKMKNFEERNKKKNFCVKVFHYNYPEGFGRKIEELPILDYFLHSPSLEPQTKEPTVFNIDLKILDHHPIHAMFNLEIKAVTIPLNLMEAGLETKATIIPPNSMKGDLVSKAAIMPPNSLKQGLASKAATISPDMMKAGFASKAVNNNGDINGANECTLCLKTFNSRRGLLVHQGKSADHYPCKEKVNDGPDKINVCIQVFNNPGDLEVHKSRHHAGLTTPSVSKTIKTKEIKERNNKCGKCEKVFDKRAAPVQCQTCSLYFHKTLCFKSHNPGTGLSCV